MCMDKAVKNLNNPLYNSLQSYGRKKILEPLGMKLSYFKGVEPKVNGKYISMSFARDANTASTDTSGNLTVASYLCDPNYIKDGKVGKTVWCSEYPNDGLSNLNRLYYDQYDPTDIFPGGSPLICSIGDMTKLFKLLIKHGVAEDGTRVLSKQATLWVLSPKMTSLNNLFWSYPISQDNDSITWCGGIAKINTDIVVAAPQLTSSNFYLWGGSQGTYGIFDSETGNYALHGIQQNSFGYIKYNIRTSDVCQRILVNAMRK